MIQKPQATEPTGADLLLALAGQIATDDRVDPEAAKAFQNMIYDAFVEPRLASSPELHQIANGQLDRWQHASTVITGLAICYAQDNKVSQETFLEVMRVGLHMVAKFEEYVEASVPKPSDDRPRQP